MRRYWVPADSIQDTHVQFSGDIHHHICDVCRMQVGSRFEVLTEKGQAYLVEMEEVHAGKRPHSTARVLETREIAPLPRPYIHLALSLSRFPTMDAIVEKAVELGVYQIHPFFSEFSFVRQAEKVSPQKLARWDKIVISATQQTGRGQRMKIETPVALEKIFEKMNRNANAMGLFAYEGESDLSLKQALIEIKSKSPEDIWLFVGSEGGFSSQEVQKFRQMGLRPITLGSQVLRVETACVALVSVIKYEFD